MTDADVQRLQQLGAVLVVRGHANAAGECQRVGANAEHALRADGDILIAPLEEEPSA